MSVKVKGKPVKPVDIQDNSDEAEGFWWMVTGTVHFKEAHPEKVDQFIIRVVEANVLSRTPESKFGHAAFDGVHREFARRLYEEHGVGPNEITAITMKHISHLGYMTNLEIFGPKKDAPAEAPANPLQ